MQQIKITRASGLGHRIRRERTTDVSNVVGVLFVGDVVEVLAYGGEWMHVRKGDVEGWALVGTGELLGWIPHPLAPSPINGEGERGQYVEFPPEFLLPAEDRHRLAGFLRWVADLLENYPYGQGEL